MGENEARNALQPRPGGWCLIGIRQKHLKWLMPKDGLFPQRDTWRPLNPSFPTRISHLAQKQAPSPLLLLGQWFLCPPGSRGLPDMSSSFSSSFITSGLCGLLSATVFLSGPILLRYYLDSPQDTQLLTQASQQSS